MRYNVTAILQSQDTDNSQPVEIGYGRGLTEIGAASSVVTILDAEAKFVENPRESWDPNLLGIKVMPIPERLDDVDLLAHMQKMLDQLQAARTALTDEAEGNLRQASFQLTVLADQMHNIVTNW